MKLSVLLPDPELPWKKPGTLSEKARQSLLSADVQELRACWRRFAELTAEHFRMIGHEAEVVVRPGWEFTPEFVNALRDADVVLIPHRHAAQMPGLQRPALYYMQVLCRWLFTVDPRGWGAAAAGYPCAAFIRGDATSPAFERCAERLQKSNSSKFAQPPRRSRLGLWRRLGLPLARYVFFPCQIPHDESARFCDRPEVEVVAALAGWAELRRIHIVFKEHPVNPKSMLPLKEAAAPGRHVHWVSASIHDLIRHGTAVYTLNSGVGFEALLHGKPVVTFGRIDYDAVTIHGNIDHLDDTWRDVQQWDRRRGTGDYRRFVDWYCREYAVDLAEEDRLPARLQTLAHSIARFAAADAHQDLAINRAFPAAEQP